jgi:hypothetical protein
LRNSNEFLHDKMIPKQKVVNYKVFNFLRSTKFIYGVFPSEVV